MSLQQVQNSGSYKWNPKKNWTLDPIDETLKGTSTWGQNEPGSNGYEGVT